MKRWIQQPSKYFVTLVIYILVFSCIVFFIFGDYLALAGYVISILLIMLPQYLFSRSPRVRRNVSNELMGIIQLIAAFSAFTNLLGSFYYYNLSSTCQYDLIIHFINPILIFSVTPVFVLIFQKHFFGKSNLAVTLIGNFILVIFLSFLWESYESIVDSIFTGANMFGQIDEIYYDTISDLIADFAGGILASLLIYKYFYPYLLRNTINQNESR